MRLSLHASGSPIPLAVPLAHREPLSLRLAALDDSGSSEHDNARLAVPLAALVVVLHDDNSLTDIDDHYRVDNHNSTSIYLASLVDPTTMVVNYNDNPCVYDFHHHSNPYNDNHFRVDNHNSTTVYLASLVDPTTLVVNYNDNPCVYDFHHHSNPYNDDHYRVDNHNSTSIYLASLVDPTTMVVNYNDDSRANDNNH